MMVTETLLFTLPNTGVCVGGEFFTAVDNTDIFRSGYPHSIKNYWLQDDGRIAIVTGATISGQVAIVRFEFDINGTLVQARVVYYPTVTPGNPSSRRLDVYPIGDWEHYVFYDVGPIGTTPTYIKSLSYWAVKKDFSKTTLVLCSTGTSALFDPTTTTRELFSFAGPGSIMLGVWNSGGPLTVHNFSYLCPINSDGSPIPLAGLGKNRLPTQFELDGNGVSDLRYRRYNPQLGLYFLSKGMVAPSGTPGRQMSAVFRSTSLSTAEDVTARVPHEYFRQVLQYRTLPSITGFTSCVLDDYLVTSDFCADNTTDLFPTSQSISAAMPLGNGYWLAETYFWSGEPMYGMQLYREI